MLADPLAAQKPQGPLPRVHFVATGGTISNRDGGRLTAEELAKSMPGVDRFARLTHEQFTNVASSELTLAQWLGLSKRVNEVFATDKELAGIVVTSGTDTLEETAFFLHLTVRDPRPVVVVGSMRNPSTIGYEGAANLLEGVRVAADPASRNKGALVVLNDEINSARNVTKSDALRLQTFRSREYGQLGVVDRDRVVFFSQILQRHNEQIEFDITKVSELPRVDVIMVYQGASGDLDQVRRRQRRERHCHRRSRRRRDERDAERRPGLRRVEGRLHRDQHAHRQRSHRPAAATARRPAARGSNTEPRTAAAAAVHHCGRGSHADQGACAADGRAHEDDRSQRAAADLQRILSRQAVRSSGRHSRAPRDCRNWTTATWPFLRA